MSKTFPTKEELAVKYEKWATFLTFITFTGWVVCFYVLAIAKFIHASFLIAFVFICPALYLGAMRCAYLTLQYKPSTSGKILLACSTLFFLLSLSMWFWPIF